MQGPGEQILHLFVLLVFKLRVPLLLLDIMQLCRCPETRGESGTVGSERRSALSVIDGVTAEESPVTSSPHFQDLYGSSQALPLRSRQKAADPGHSDL